MFVVVVSLYIKKPIFTDFLKYYSGGTLEGLATMSSYNNIPLCDGEMADFIKFYSGVVDDVGPDAVSRQDIAATFAESLGAPGTY